jgi:hypothetical protein
MLLLQLPVAFPLSEKTGYTYVLDIALTVSWKQLHMEWFSYMLHCKQSHTANSSQITLHMSVEWKLYSSRILQYKYSINILNNMEYGIRRIQKVFCKTQSFVNMGRSRWTCGIKSRCWPLGCWDRGFEFRWGHGCLFLCLYVVLSCVGAGLCEGLITRLKKCCQVSKLDYETSRVRRPRFLQGL